MTLTLDKLWSRFELFGVAQLTLTIHFLRFLELGFNLLMRNSASLALVQDHDASAEICLDLLLVLRLGILNDKLRLTIGTDVHRLKSEIAIQIVLLDKLLICRSLLSSHASSTSMAAAISILTEG